MFAFDATVSKPRTQPSAYLLLQLVSEAGIISYVLVAEKPLCCGCIYKCRHLLCGRFGSRYTQISFTTINKQLRPICHAVCVPTLTHSTVIYSLLLPAMRAADELGIKPEDSHFSSLTGWTSAGRCISLQAPLMDCRRINRDKLSVFHFLLGHYKMESQPFEKDNITDFTLGGYW